MMTAHRRLSKRREKEVARTSSRTVMRILVISFSPGCLLVLAVSLLVLIGGHGVRPTQAQIRDGAHGGVLLDPKNPPAYSDERPDDKVEDALALGNSARSARPPRYPDAERAYRLAAKLEPRDPRPYIGLANIYIDQKRFKEASDAYVRAIELVNLRPVRGLREPARIRPAPDRGAPTARVNYVGDLNGEWHAYLGSALLQQGEFGRAGFEFSKAILQDPKNAQWHALRGHALLAQKRYSAAISSFESAVRLDLANAGYKELLDQSLSEQKKAQAQDGELAEKLTDTIWHISSERHGKIECNLATGGKMTCTSGKGSVRSDELWKVEGGLVHTYTDDGHCLGNTQGNQMTINCEDSQMPSSQQPDGRYQKWQEIWIRKQ